MKGQKIEFDGTPFFLLATKIYDCQHGQDRNAQLKARLQQLHRQKQVTLTHFAQFNLIKHLPVVFMTR